MATAPYSIKNIRLFIAFRILFNARFYYPVFTILFLDFGLTIEQFAILNSVWALTIVFAEVPSGALADILGRKYLIVTTAVLMVLEMCLLAFVPLHNMQLVFWAFLINRILSGLAEAMASGADEAIAYDSLIAEGDPRDWPQVLSLQLRLRSIISVVTMTLGSLLYDPNMVNSSLRLLHINLELTQQDTMRFPLYLTLILAISALAASLQMREPPVNNKEEGFTFKTALKKTIQAGLWIARTPFALAIILFGMCYDHILRMIVTMTSQYFRLIDLPEASFGFIGSVTGLLGIATPKIAEIMVEKNSPAVNMYWVSAISFVALLGLTFFIPYLGLLPMVLVFVSMTFVSFFTSHYLNQITDSSQRATVLSFKGLAFNLAYGFIGIAFAQLIAQLEDRDTLLHPDWPVIQIKNLAFIEGVGWFPWYFLACLLILFIYNSRKLKGTNYCPPHRTSKEK